MKEMTSWHIEFHSINFMNKYSCWFSGTSYTCVC